MDELIDIEMLDKKLKTMIGWSRNENAITKTYERRDFSHAMGFVMQVSLIAERHDHHPDIDIRWNKVSITLSTHSAGGLTMKDLTMAKQIDEL